MEILKHFGLKKSDKKNWQNLQRLTDWFNISQYIYTKYLQSELFGIFQLKPVTKIILFGSLASHFMLMTMKFDLLVLLLLFKNNFGSRASKEGRSYF